MAQSEIGQGRIAAVTSEPIAISYIAGRYLLFDINVVTHLRRNHNICGVLIGGIPQIPQQNLFLGLPLELLPEEARLLVDKKIAYVVDDTAWHKSTLNTLQGEDRKNYLESLRSQGLQAKRTANEAAKKRQEHGLAKQAARRAMNTTSSIPTIQDTSAASDSHVQEDQSEPETLFSNDRPISPTPSTLSLTETPLAITPTTTHPYLPLRRPEEQSRPAVPSSYPLFAHLHSRDYFITPGLRFGCDYTVYPGDPLRFHSHFLAVGHDWEEEIPMLDLVGGGRLGTGVKKGFLIGGENPDAQPEGDGVRTFCIEWGGM
ncbi:tRNA intron endonuclease [Phlyctema vagabunda]|uniref:tRNA-splicing endonuclease subunit Sen34 n=1 Tax=Phlyctema vagabunda TaxID=108571 RepID=A0ABR4PVH6_9HELO